ncbi:argininosuccinate lyase [Candidatus Microgenomates bacterium]|nr:argininosuccinate lyase [Candidatus Microgenomates bacterium]
MKTQKLWVTGKSKLNPIIEAFETRDDIAMDQKLIKYDVLGSLAHAMMLYKIGILSKSELVKLEKGLLEILSLDKQGKFVISMGDEDVHTKIENYLTEKFGEAGKKIHTARSRNDQVITATRLYTKEELLLIWGELLSGAKSLVAFAQKHEFVPMPGYTHMQKAMPSSLGMWAGAFAQNLLDDLSLLKSAFALNNQSPLGSAAGFGVPLSIDREYTAKLLGFAKVQANSLSVQNSRGKIEANIVASLLSILLTINKFATDVLLYTTSEFNYFTVSETLLTGSSMLPQKKNVDVAELLQSKVHVVLGFYTTLISLTANLSSGYNRGLQDSKKPLFESLDITKNSLAVANILINNISPNVKILEKAMTAEIFATHKAMELVKKGMPFREAYQKVAGELASLARSHPFGSEPQGRRLARLKVETEDPHKILKQATHTGATGNLGLSALAKTLQKEKKELEEQNKKWNEVSKDL